MTVLIGAIAVAAWLYLLTARGQFWRFRELLPDTAASPARRVAVVIPARDEAEGIADTIKSLLTQRFSGTLQIFLVDDHSTDDTAALARDAASLAGAADRLTVIRGGPLEPGWTGKLRAVAQGIEAARAFSPDYILLTDADIAHAPDSVSSLIVQAERGGFDLTSVMVRLHVAHRSEALLIPAFVYFFFMLYPPSWIARVGNGSAGAAGGCMLVRPEALNRIGGLDTIRGELIDDCALARAIKHSGGRVWLGLPSATRSTREYRTFGEIRHMIARTAYTQLHYSPLLLSGTLAGLALLYFAGPVLAIGAHGVARILGLAAWVLMSVSFVPALRFYRRPLFFAPLLPLASAFYTEATIASALRFHSGRGGQWKGRAQAALRNSDAE